MAVVTIQNRKGGVAKTTSVVHFATIVALAGKRALAVDMDPQGNTSQVFRVFNKNKPDVTDLLFKGCALEDVIVKSKYGVDVIPNNKHIPFPDLYFGQNGYKDMDLMLLREKIEKVRKEYDLIIIDNNPSGCIFAYMSLIAADYVIIPVDSSNFSYDGISDELNNFYEIRDKYNEELQLLGVLMAHVKPQTRLLKAKYSQYDKSFDSLLLKAVIRDDIQIADAIARYMPVYYYNSKTNAGADYIEAAKQTGIINLDDHRELSGKYIGEKNKYVFSL